MVSTIGSITPNINQLKPTVTPLVKTGISQSTNAIAEALAQTTAHASETLFASTEAQIAQKAVQQTAKRSFLSKIFRVFSGDFADDIAIAFKNRKNVPFKEGFKNNFGFTQTCTTAAKEAKKAGFFGKIFPFMKNSKIAKVCNAHVISTLVVLGMQILPIYRAFKKHGASEGLKETLKLGITTAFMLGAEALVAVLSAYTGGFAGLLRMFAPAMGGSLGWWLGNKILGKSIDEKKQDIIVAKHNQQLQELIQNPQIVQQIQKNPQLLQKLQEDPNLTDQIYQNMKKEELAQNQQNNNGQSLPAQVEQIRQQIANNGKISPEEQKRRDNYASQFGNPYQSTSLGTFSNLVHNVDVPFAQMVVRQENLYNPFQSLLLCEQMQNDLAARGYIFG